MSVDDEFEIVQAGPSRALTGDQRRLAAQLAKLESESLASLEEAARQIIGLVSGFFAVVLGLLALGGEAVDDQMRSVWVQGAGGAALAFLLLALIAALEVVVPALHRVRIASLADRAAAYDRILSRKGTSLHAAAIFFGLGIASLAALIAALLYDRWR